MPLSSQKFGDSSCGLRCGDSIRIETVRLDRAARDYEAYLRTQRYLRAGVGQMVPYTLGAFAFCLTLFARFEEPEIFLLIIVVVAISVLTVVGLLMIFYLGFWMLRTFAAGSLRAARIILTISSFAILSEVVNLTWNIFDFATVDTQPNGSRDWSLPIFALYVAAEGMALFVAYLFLTGIFRFLKFRESLLLPLFLNHNYQREFWPGGAMLLRNLWTVMGIPVLLNQKVSKRVAIAALVAISVEGSVFLWIAGLPGRIELAQYRPDFTSRSLFFLVGAAVVSAPFFFWLFFALSRRLRRYARQGALLSMDEARLADPRRPVLFLRSFGDDQVSLAQAKIPWLLRFFDPLAIAGTLEELLLREFGYLGPVLALGKPSDGLPPLGVARKYCRGETWREVVGSLMDEASLIVVGVGRSEGLAWEIGSLRDKGLLSKTVFILPPARVSDHAALGRLFRLLGAGEATPNLVLDRAALAIWFSAPNYGLVLVSERVSETEYELALRAPRLADLAEKLRRAGIDD
jgi:hypothetical protein